MKTLLLLLMLALAGTRLAQAQGSGPQLSITQAAVVGTVAVTPYGELLSMYVTVDAQGNTCLAGGFVGQVSFGATTLISGGAQDVFVAKRTPTGAYLWAVQAGGARNEYVGAITTDAVGNVYVTGSFESPTATFGLTTLRNASNPVRETGDVFLTKLGAGGAWQWASGAGGGTIVGGQDRGKALAVDATGDVYVAGTFDSPVAFFGAAGQLQTYSTSWTNPDIFLGKLAGSTGAWQWIKQAGNENDDEVDALALDAAGSLYLTSYSGSGAHYGLFTLPATINGLVVSKLDAAGGWQWVSWTERSRPRYTASPTTSGQIALDNQGSLYIAGDFNADSVRFGSSVLTNTGALSPNSTSPSYRTANAFVAKLNTGTGAWRWAVQSAGDGGESLSNPVLDGQGSVYVGGSFGPPQFRWGPTVGTFGTTTLASAGGSDAVIARLDTAGRWQGAWRTGGSNSEALAGYGFGAQGQLLLVGAFGGATTTLGNVTLTGTGGMFGTKFLGQAGTLNPLATQAAAHAPVLLDVYPNPAHGTVTVSGPLPGRAVQVLDMLGRRVLGGTVPPQGELQLVLPAGLPVGVYVVRAGTQARRLVVE